MQEVSLTHYIIQAIRDEGASHVFLVPGGYVDNFSQALVDVKGITPVVCATELGAAFMADGFARAAGRFGVCMGISGPGASNMITGLSVSHVDQTPVLVITGDAPMAWHNRDAIQDPSEQGLNTTNLLASVSDVQMALASSRLAEDHLRRLMHVLKGPTQGVAHLAVPLDLQLDRQPYRYHNFLPDASRQTRVIDEQALDLALHTIASSARTIVLVGTGVRKANAFDALRAFAERYGLPVATTMSAKGDFPEDHALSMGVFGWAGSALANVTLLSDEVDCLLVLGTRLGQINTMCWSEALRKNRKLIQLDLNSEHLNKTYLADLAITSDAKAALEYWSECSNTDSAPKAIEQDSQYRREWLGKLRADKPEFYDRTNTQLGCVPMHPARAITALQQSIRDEVGGSTHSHPQLFVDNGAHTFFATHYWPISQANSYFNIIKYSGAMGWAIAASIGAKMAKPDQLCVAVVGDGCMLMQGMEIQTAARYGLNGMIFVVLNNKAHGNPKLRTGGFTAKAEALTDIVDHNWAAFAESLGVKGLSVDDPAQLQHTYKQALCASGPVLIDVKCGLFPTPTKVFDETFMKEFNRYINNQGVSNEQRQPTLN